MHLALPERSNGQCVRPPARRIRPEIADIGRMLRPWAAGASAIRPALSLCLPGSEAIQVERGKDYCGDDE